MHPILRAESDQARLEVKLLELDATALKFSYTVQNLTNQNVYVFNRVYKGLDDSGAYRTDPNLVYVESDASGVTVSKKIIPVPDNIDVEKPIVPCVTKVRAGAFLTEEVTLALPLKPWTPYPSPPAALPNQTPVLRPVRIEISYFAAAPQTDGLARTVQTTAGPALHFYPFNPANQRILRVGPLPTSAPVLVGK